jgi:hypothetical protein
MVRHISWILGLALSVRVEWIPTYTFWFSRVFYFFFIFCSSLVLQILFGSSSYVIFVLTWFSFGWCELCKAQVLEMGLCSAVGNFEGGSGYACFDWLRVSIWLVGRSGVGMGGLLLVALFCACEYLPVWWVRIVHGHMFRDWWGRSETGTEHHSFGG